MKIKGIIITIFLCIIIGIIYTVNLFEKEIYEEANKAFLVYLNGEKIGIINNNEALYSLINHEQEEIRNKYMVNSVYPPSDFDLIEVKTYNENYASVNDIYKKIEELDNFTIKGYVVTIKSNDEEKEDIIINVLDKEVFESAINKFILSFIGENELNNYLEGHRTISDIGSIINSMYFNETITIKESFISVNEKIFTDVDSLSQYLLFGPDAKMDKYTVKLGDTIASISEDYQINSQEFIIANPVYRNEDTMLAVGSKVNVTLIDPVLTLVYEVYQIEEKVTPFTKKEVVDNTKSSDFSEITQAGVDGIDITHSSYQVINGEASSELKNISREVIREMVEQVKTIGKKQTYITGQYVNIGGSWGLPTYYPYYVTSRYGWRSHKMHYGIDISGTGFRSPIFAVADATVVEVSYRSTDGNYIILQHENNIYTQYAHLYRATVNVGDTVSRGQTIGEMGSSGLSNGVHLHFGVSVGWPYNGAYTFLNPNEFIKMY
ncbi:MAG: M23 family metallopeptidase [Firmicutes bacterium]|nr:M23 family metallopeptidase [Bacillota bacterium]